MADSLFDIFGDHIVKQAMKNVSRQPLSNVENMGKTIRTPSGPVKPNEPVKKLDSKKSFLSNKGMAFQSTPARKVFTPRTVNVGPLIYSDADSKTHEHFNFEEIEFTKPSYNYDNYNSDVFDFLPMPGDGTINESPPLTPPPATEAPIIEFDYSYQDIFFTDDFSNESLDVDDLGLPKLY